MKLIFKDVATLRHGDEYLRFTKGEIKDISDESLIKKLLDFNVAEKFIDLNEPQEAPEIVKEVATKVKEEIIEEAEEVIEEAPEEVKPVVIPRSSTGKKSIYVSDN